MEDTEVQEQQPPAKLTVDQFAEKIKAKYPDYANIDNKTLTQKILAKYPDYASRVSLDVPKKESGAGSPPISPKLQNGGSNAPATKTAKDYKDLFDYKALQQIKTDRDKHMQELDDPSSKYYQDKTAAREKADAEYDKIPLLDKVKSLSNNAVGGLGDIAKGAIRQAATLEKYI